MKTRVGILAAALLVIGVPGISLGTTITFQSAASGDNADIPTTYGSNISGNSTGFVTTDGTGATPDIALNWSPSPNYWEYHTGTVWSTLGTPVHVAQLDERVGKPGYIEFTVGPTVALNLISLDLGVASDASGSIGWTIDVLRSSNNALELRTSTGSMSASATTTVTFNWTGDVGVDYKLRFNSSVSGTFNTAIDNLSFAQAVPEPSTNLMLVLGASAIGFFRFRPGRSRKAVSGC